MISGKKINEKVSYTVADIKKLLNKYKDDQIVSIAANISLRNAKPQPILELMPDGKDVFSSIVVGIDCEDIYVDFGIAKLNTIAWIKKLNAIGFSNYRIAKDTEISHAAISYWMDGKAKPSKTYANIIEKYAKEKGAI